jgi:hypothetical protein
MSSRDLGQLSEPASLVALNARDPFGVTPRILKHVQIQGLMTLMKGLDEKMYPRSDPLSRDMP